MCPLSPRQLLMFIASLRDALLPECLPSFRSLLPVVVISPFYEFIVLIYLFSGVASLI